MISLYRVFVEKRFLGALIAIDVELDEYRDVFGHCSQRAEEPGQVADHVISLERMEEDLLDAVSVHE